MLLSYICDAHFPTTAQIAGLLFTCFEYGNSMASRKSSNMVTKADRRAPNSRFRQEPHVFLILFPYFSDYFHIVSILFPYDFHIFLEKYENRIWKEYRSHSFQNVGRLWKRYGNVFGVLCAVAGYWRHKSIYATTTISGI